MKTTIKIRENEKVCVEMGSHAKHMNWSVHFDCFYLYGRLCTLLFSLNSFNQHFSSPLYKMKRKIVWTFRAAYFLEHLTRLKAEEKSKKRPRKWNGNVMKKAFDILFYNVLYSLNIVLRAHSSSIFVPCEKFI